MSETNRWRRKAFRVAKSALCVMLCCVMVFAYSFKKPTEAHATSVVVAEVVGAVAVAAALTALGVYANGTVDDETYTQTCQKIWDNIDNGIKNKITYMAVAAGGVYYLTSEFLTSVGNQLATAYNTALDFITATSPDNLPEGKQLKTGYIDEETMARFFGYETAGIQRNSHSMSVPFTVVGIVSFSQHVGEENALMLGGMGETYEWRIYSNGNNRIYVKEYLDGVYKTYFSFPKVNRNFFYLCTYVTSANGKLCYALAHEVSKTRIVIDARSLIFTDDAVGTAPGRDVLGVDIDKWIADGFSILNNKVSDVVDKVNDVAGKLDDNGSLQIPISVPQNKIDADLRTKTQDKVLPKSISDEQSKEKNDETNKGKNTAPPKLPGLPDIALPNILTKKFPFCIPFDIYVIISGFYCAEAKAPCWEIPVENDRLGWHWKIVLDWSQFEPIAILCRWFTGAAWVFALILATRKLIGAGGGD